MSDQVAFEDGPCFTETCELCDPEFVFIPENPTVDVTEIENLEDYAINSEMVPLTDLEFYVYKLGSGMGCKILFLGDERSNHTIQFLW